MVNSHKYPVGQVILSLALYQGHLEYTSDTGLGVGIDLEAFSLKTNTHSSRRYYASCEGRKSSNGFYPAVKPVNHNNGQPSKLISVGTVMRLLSWEVINSCLTGFKTSVHAWYCKCSQVHRAQEVRMWRRVYFCHFPRLV